MAAFDPDAYLAQKSSAPVVFDPDAYLASKTAPSEIPGPRSLASQIPTEAGANLATTQVQPSSFLGELRGGLETIPALASGAVSGVVSPIVGLAGAVLQGKGPAEGERISKQVSQAMTYQPRTPEAQRNVEVVGNALAPLIGVPIPTLNALGQAAPAAIRAVRDVARSEANLVGGAIAAPLEARAARIQEGRVAQSYANAPIIDAAKAAERQGFAVNPAITNPTAGNRVKGMLVGPAFNETANQYNAAQATKVVRKDLGIAANERLDASAIDRALDQASAPYAPIRAMPVVQASDDVLSSIRALDKPATLGGKAQSKVVTLLVDDVIQELQAGRSGAQILDDIRQMRRNAQNVYKARDSGGNPPPADVAQADARMGIANALEKLIDENAPNANVLKDFQQARQRMAQIYDQERAINYANETVDPQIFAKLLDEKKGGMTGVGADIGKVAAQFPDIMGTQAPAAQVMPKVTRSGALSALGALAGGAVAGYPGAIGGAGLGGAAGWVGSRLAAKGMTNPAYQSARAMPTDYRPAPNMLRPAEINYGPNQLVPYDYSQQIFTKEQIPNWRFGQGEPNVPNVSVGPIPAGPAQLGAPSAESTLGSIASERARAAGMSRTLGQQAEAQQAAAESASRKTTGRGVQYDLDPITGRLVPTSAGVKGATPEVFMADTGQALNAAAEKVAAGKLFDMSAAEKVAWNKTKVDLATAAPELKGLSDKAVAAKMMDRQWVNDTINKIRQQAAAFDEISKRATTAQAMRDASMKREKMLDMLSDLEDSLRSSRPVSSGGQGKKTREFNRNQLITNTSNKNALAESP